MAVGWKGKIAGFSGVLFRASAMILLQGTRNTMKKQRSKLLPRDKLRKTTGILLRSHVSQKFCHPSLLFPFCFQPTCNKLIHDGLMSLHFSFLMVVQLKGEQALEPSPVLIHVRDEEEIKELSFLFLPFSSQPFSILSCLGSCASQWRFLSLQCEGTWATAPLGTTSGRCSRNCKIVSFSPQLIP